MDAPTQETIAEVGHAPAAQEQGLPQLDTASFGTQLFWLALTFALLYLLMARSVLPRIHEVLEKRQQRLMQDIDRAESLSHDAEEAKAAFEKLHAETKAKAGHWMEEALRIVESVHALREEELDRELAAKLAKAREEIRGKVAAAQSRLEPVVKEVTQALVGKLAGVSPGAAQVSEAIERNK